MGALSRVSGFATLPIRSIPPTTVHLSIDYIEVTLVSLPRLSRGYFVGVILQVSRPGWDRTTQSLYALKLRDTIIGYVPLLIVYGSLKPLLGEIYLLHSSSTGDISRIVFIFGGSFKSFEIFYPAHMVNPACDCPPEH